LGDFVNLLSLIFILIIIEGSQEKDEQCLYCGETFPNPLPLKVLEYLNDIVSGKSKVSKLL
jgi:hypothetical protein